MTINIIQLQNKDSLSTNPTSNKSTLLRGAQAFSTALALYCSIKLFDLILLKLKETYYPELLDTEELFDFQQAEFERELADLRADYIGPVEVSKTILSIVLPFLKIISLVKVTGVSQTIKEKIEKMKKYLFNMGKTQQEHSIELENISSDDDLRGQSSTIRREKTSKDILEITSTALELVNTITPSNAIANIATIERILLEVKKPLETSSNLNISEKIVTLTGHVGKLGAEFASIPAIGKGFSNILLITGSLLKILDKENAA